MFMIVIYKFIILLQYVWRHMPNVLYLIHDKIGHI